ncbi:hypothetical protein GGR50DRAFT_326324 [Xylaria sp. CBS 124048]|nr:hypothetical protein GGR50DRAFT_326324 [Xylaria sp. CBS 124048]
MSPTNHLPGEPGNYPGNRPAASTSSTAPSLHRFAAAPAHPHQRNDESWVEVSSHPSSSSVSSIGEEIVITGLQVASSTRFRRRRQQQQRSAAHANATQTPGDGHAAAGGSSQEEYDETESEEDHFLTSSTENLVPGSASHQAPVRRSLLPQVVDLDSSDDDDENATALGRRPPEPFRPQPNAFSHPPSHLIHRHTTGSTIPQHSRRPSFNRRSHTRADRRPADFLSPNYQADNDAALRASLSTLLRCAAAARSLSKDGEKETPTRPGPVGSSQPVALRFAPESELMAPSSPSAPSQGSSRPGNAGPTRPPPAPAPTPTPTPAAVAVAAVAATATATATADRKSKRATTPSGSKTPRATKKKRTSHSEDALISPTLLTWVVSAGVVVLVSVVGFGAGYVIGREVGRRETLSSFSGAGNLSAVSDGGNCGREALRGGGGTLRRFRWGTGMGRSVAA